MSSGGLTFSGVMLKAHLHGITQMNFYPETLQRHTVYLCEDIVSPWELAARYTERLIVPLLIAEGQDSLVDWTSPHWKRQNPEPFFVSPYGLECIRKGMLPELDTNGYQVVNFRTGAKLGYLAGCQGCC